MKYLIVLLLLPLSVFAAQDYTVKFSGIKDGKVLELIEKTSQLKALKPSPPQSAAGLKRRAENDIVTIKRALQSMGYYDSNVKLDLNFSTSPATVLMKVKPGPIFTFEEAKVYPEKLNIRSTQIEICPGMAAFSKAIFKAEENLICLLEKKGYPFSKVLKREIVADKKNKTIQPHFYLETGPLSYFGETIIAGNEAVFSEFIEKHIAWKEGARYDPEKISKTVQALEKTSLFSAISVTPSQEADENGNVLMTIEVIEAKFRSVSLGLSYATQRGPGFGFEWENRNFRGMGEKFAYDAEILQDTQDFTVSYVKPAFLYPNQNLIWKAELQHDTTQGYEESAFMLSNLLERQIGPHSKRTFGLMYKGFHVGSSDNDGSYHLLKAQYLQTWSSANDLLNPTEGFTFHFKVIPSLQMLDPHFFYTSINATSSGYFSISDRFVFASRISFGSIVGASRHNIPASERLYGGSENTLRGYNYYTVSPLDKDRNPIGGRSLLAGTVEGRWHFSKDWGGTLFYDVGNVYKDYLPDFKDKILQSIGVGIRYFTPVGPLRLDAAFPLNRRKDVDDPFQIYFSVGQAF